MIKKFLIITLSTLIFVLCLYVYPSSPDFPKPPDSFVQSDEPADVETPLRRGYYTDMNRDEVINYYKKEFNKGFNIYTPRLNYPPEDSPLLIRDQTKTSYLEEIVHPLRESIYINGFEPKTEQYAQFFKGVRYNQKVIVRYVPSPVWIRISVLVATGLVSYFLILEYIHAKK
jgi:hypothetical protein